MTIAELIINYPILSSFLTLGHVSVLEWLLSNNLANGLERDDYGATPVHDAAEHGRVECLQVFYNHSVCLTIQDANGFTPG